MPVAHDPSCPRANGPHSDAAKRVSDQYNLHKIGAGYDAIGKVFAVNLGDGRSDGALYADMYDAVLHQKHNERWYGFIRVNPASMSPCQAESFLTALRPARERDISSPDRHHSGGGRVLIPRLTLEDQRAQVRQTLFGSRPSNLILPN